MRILFAALLAGLVIGCGSAASAPQPPPPPKVIVGSPLRKHLVEWDEYVGRLDAVDFVEVRARVGGYLESTHFEEGQIVEKGALLCVIDPRPFEAEVARATADLSEARGRVTESNAVIARSIAQRNAASARLDLEKSRLERSKSLLEKKVISPEDHDLRESEFMQAEAAVAATDAEIESARAAVVTAEAAVETADARLKLANLNLDYTQVRAPISGRMSRRIVTEGNLVNGGTDQATLLTTIVSLDPIHCYFDADELAFLKYERLKQEGKRQSSRDVKNPIYLALADEGDRFTHTGHMDFVENRLDPNTGTIRGRAILANSDLTLTPGLFTRIRLPGSGRYEAILIPDRAIGTDQSDKFVFVLGEDNTVRRQVITLGPTAHGLRIVRMGLDGSEKIVLRGLQRLRPGIAVTPETQEIAIEIEDGLPDDYEPVPKEKWLSRTRPSTPETPSPEVPQEAEPAPTESAPQTPPPDGTNAANG